MPIRTLGPEGGGPVLHRLEKVTSASKDVGPRRGVDCEISHRFGRRTKHFLQGRGNLSLADAF